MPREGTYTVIYKPQNGRHAYGTWPTGMNGWFWNSAPKYRKHPAYASLRNALESKGQCERHGWKAQIVRTS